MRSKSVTPYESCTTRLCIHVCPRLSLLHSCTRVGGCVCAYAQALMQRAVTGKQGVMGKGSLSVNSNLQPRLPNEAMPC